MLKDVVGYEGLYTVSEEGKVYGKKNQPLKPYLNEWGYRTVVLYKNGTKKHKKIHRLVAEAFMPNVQNMQQVNHLHRCHSLGKTPQNLTMLHKKNRQKVLCVETGDIFKSITDAAHFANRATSTMSYHLKGKTENCGGYHFRRAE